MSTKRESDKIWEEIKDLPIAMFALSNQVVSNHVERIDLDPSVVHLRTKSSAVIASLDDAVNCVMDRAGNVSRTGRYEIEQAEGGFLVVKRGASKLNLVQIKQDLDKADGRQARTKTRANNK